MVVDPREIVATETTILAIVAAFISLDCDVSRAYI
jgi:hypothetical protein